MFFDYAVHSGFLIHWTAKDIDCLYDPLWDGNKKGQSITHKDCTDAYIERLYNILKHGLWMTIENKNDLNFGVDKYPIKIPSIPQVCFTELKLSESRKHAKQYGIIRIIKTDDRGNQVERGNWPIELDLDACRNF